MRLMSAKRNGNMDGLMKRVKTILSRAFPHPSKVNLRDEDGIIGIVTSPRFRGKDDFARQDLIWNVLDKQLRPEERRRIVIMVAVTPEEEIAHTK